MNISSSDLINLRVMCLVTSSLNSRPVSLDCLTTQASIPAGSRDISDRVGAHLMGKG